MSVKTETVITWTCDRCGKSVVQKEMPSSVNDPWGKLMIEQPSGFDASGAAWCPRMREPMMLCGSCIEEIAIVIGQKPKAK